MSSFFRKVMLCGCSTRTGIEGQTFVVDESVDDDPSKSTEFPSVDEQPSGVARHFDLSAIKFIDDEEMDDDLVSLRNGRETAKAGLSGREVFVVS